MSLFTNKNIKVASRKSSRVNLSSDVVTTQDFGFILPVYAREAVPGDKWNLNISSFSRLAPMPVPTYSNIKIINRAFYVKFSDVWRPWNEFYQGIEFPCEDGSPVLFDSVPVVTNARLVSYLTNTSKGLVTVGFKKYHGGFGGGVQPNLADEHDYNGTFGAGTRSDDTTRTEGGDGFRVVNEMVCDFRVYSSTLNAQGGHDVVENTYLFTRKGKLFYTILSNLGYKLNGDPADTTSFSLLPLLCYARAFYDYYLPSKYSVSHFYRCVFNVAEWTDDTLNDFLDEFADSMFAYFDNDYFTGSVDSPLGIQSNISSDIDESFAGIKYTPVDSPYSVHDMVYVQHQGDSVISPGDQKTEGLISQYGLNLLKKAYDWSVRRGLAGNKYVDTIFSQFGLKIHSCMDRRCEFLGSTVQPVQISDVTSTSMTTNGGFVTALGDYAGKGITYNKGSNITCQCNDFGMVIVLSHIVPESSIVQGRNREILHINRFDYFNPEFDNLGFQPVRNDELFTSALAEEVTKNLYGSKPNGIFGYVPRYAEYKTGRSLLSGDFICGSRNQGYDSYHCFRLFDTPSDNKPLTNSRDFRVIDPVRNGSNFDRIFNYQSPDYDHFITAFNIKANVFRKMASLMDNFDLLDGSNEVSIDNDRKL